MALHIQVNLIKELKKYYYSCILTATWKECSRVYQAYFLENNFLYYHHHGIKQPLNKVFQLIKFFLNLAHFQSFVNMKKKIKFFTINNLFYYIFLKFQCFFFLFIFIKNWIMLINSNQCLFLIKIKCNAGISFPSIAINNNFTQ